MKNDEIPVYQGKPFVGVFPELAANPLEALKRAATLGEVVRLHLPGSRVLLITDPLKVDHVLMHHDIYTKDTADYVALRKLTRQGLIAINGAQWLKQRRTIQPAFARHHIGHFGQTMIEAGNALIERWEPHLEFGDRFELYRELARVALLIVGRTLVGEELLTNFDAANDALHELLDQTAYRVTHPWLPPEWIPIGFHRRFRGQRRVLDTLVEGVISARRRRTSRPDHDLLDLLLESKDPKTGAPLSDEVLRDEILTLVIAGHETSSNAMAFAFYLLATHPDVEARVRAELDEVLGDRPLTVEDVPRLVLLQAVLKEAMRLYPPSWALTRHVAHDDDCAGLQLKRGDVVMFSQYLMHRKASLWTDPERFDIARWLPSGEALNAGRPRSAYMPFLQGPRRCLGDSFAMMEMPILLATILRRMRVKLVPEYQLQLVAGVTLRAKEGFTVTLEDLRARSPNTVRAPQRH